MTHRGPFQPQTFCDSVFELLEGWLGSGLSRLATSGFDIEIIEGMQPVWGN